MTNMPQGKRSLESFHKLSRTALPIALSLALAACGGSSDSNSASTNASGARAMGMMKAAVAEVALTPVGATASSSERGDLNAAAAIDNNDATRWGSGFSDTEWLTLDFGQSQPINHVHISWENAHATEYELQVSDDNSKWTTLKHVTGSTGGVEDLTGLNGQGRYLRMQGIKRSTGYGYSIFE